MEGPVLEEPGGYLALIFDQVILLLLPCTQYSIDLNIGKDREDQSCFKGACLYDVKVMQLGLLFDSLPVSDVFIFVMTVLVLQNLLMKKGKPNAMM